MKPAIIDGRLGQNGWAVKLDGAKKQFIHLVQAVVLLTTAVTAIGWLGRWHYLPDLCSHFRVQLTLVSLAAGVLLWGGRRRGWGTFSLAFGLAGVVSLAPFFWPSPTDAKPSYRLLMMNVLTSNRQKAQTAEQIVVLDPDIIVVLETNDEWIETLDQAFAAEWPHRKAAPRPDNFGIAIYSQLPWDSCEFVEFPAPRPTLSISAFFDLPCGRPLRLLAAHPPPPVSHSLWRSRNVLFQKLAQDVVAGPAPSRTIVVGDLNCSPWSYWYQKLEAESGLRNSAYGHGLNASWTPLPLPLSGLPIDHALVGDRVKVYASRVGPEWGSDHRAVIVDFE